MKTTTHAHCFFSSLLLYMMKSNSPTAVRADENFALSTADYFVSGVGSRLTDVRSKHAHSRFDDQESNELSTSQL